MKDPNHDHPRSGWANPEVEALVKGRTTDPAKAKRPPKGRRGAIAGGVVGGLIGILAVAAWFFYFRRRHTPGDAHVGPELPVGEASMPGYAEGYQQDAPDNARVRLELPIGDMPAAGYVENYYPNTPAYPY